jgi:hypothetical protein
MFMPTTNYLKRITLALEHEAAPRIEDDFARGQVLAAVFLLDNLADRIDYKPDVIEKEVEKCCDTIKAIVEAVGDENLPDEIKEFMAELEGDELVKNLAFRNKCDHVLSLAIDLYFKHRDKLDPEADLELDEKIVKYITDINLRDLGMFKISCSSKLIQAKDKD